MNQAGDALIVRAPADSDYVKNGKPQIVRYDLHNRIEAQISAHMATGLSVAYVFPRIAVTNRVLADRTIGAALVL
jgi:hypothetical protein